MRYLVSILLLGVAFPVLAQNARPSAVDTARQMHDGALDLDERALEAARNLVRAMRYQERFETVADQPVQAEVDRRFAACADKNLDVKTPDAQRRDCFADLSELKHRAAPILAEAGPLYRRKLVEAVAEVYARRFTAPELQQLIAFYETPVGMKLAASYPAMDADLANKRTDLSLDIMIDVLGRLDKDTR